MNTKIKPQLIVTSSAVFTTAILGYALLHADETALRWWAGLITAALPIVALAAYWTGHTEARGHLSGLTQGIEAVTQAAVSTTDVAQRAANIRPVRQAEPTPAIQQMFLPPSVTSVTGMGGGVILPPLKAEGDLEV